jgi:hypothetical protein
MGNRREPGFVSDFWVVVWCGLVWCGVVSFFSFWPSEWSFSYAIGRGQTPTKPNERRDLSVALFGPVVQLGKRNPVR